MWVFAFISILLPSCLGAGEEELLPQTIFVQDGNNLGRFYIFQWCPQSQGRFSTQEENVQIPGYASPLNASRIYCGNKGEASTDPVNRLWQTITWCSSGVLVAKLLTVEKDYGSSHDVSGRNVMFLCSSRELLKHEGHSWNAYNEWSNTCARGICAFQAMAPEGQETLQDHAALNDVRFLCCTQK